METIGNLAERKEGRGQQTISRLVHEIKAKNLKPTHFLIVQLSYDTQLSTPKKTAFRQALFRAIDHQKYTVNLSESGDDDDDGDEVHIQWKSPNKTTAMIYYTTSRYEETYIRQLTKGLLRSTYEKICKDVGIANNRVNLTFITTKNLEYTINIVTQEVVAIGNPIDLPNTPAIEYEEEDHNVYHDDDDMLF